MPQDPRQRDGCQFTAQNITAAQEKNPFAKISDIVYELLEKAIFSSAIPPGSKLNISKLAEQIATCWEPMTIRLSFFCSVATNSQERIDR